MPTTRVSERGQVVIPKPIRDRLGIKRGQELDVDAEDGVIHLRLRKATTKSPKRDWRRWEGILEGTGALQDLEAEHRREIESGR